MRRIIRSRRPESTAPSATPPVRPAHEAMEPGMPMGEGHMMMQPGSAGGRGMNPEMMSACQGMMADMRQRDMAASMRDEPVAAAFDAINRRMHRDMAMPTGADPDDAFAQAMIAHHQGAIDMARVDPRLRERPGDPQAGAGGDHRPARRDRLPAAMAGPTAAAVIAADASRVPRGRGLRRRWPRPLSSPSISDRVWSERSAAPGPCGAARRRRRSRSRPRRSARHDP